MGCAGGFINEHYGGLLVPGRLFKTDYTYGYHLYLSVLHTYAGKVSKASCPFTCSLIEGINTTRIHQMIVINAVVYVLTFGV